MLNFTYFKSQIEDEIEGGENYIKLAISLKGSYPQWSKTFYEMSTVELGHAINLFRMAEEFCKQKTNESPESKEYISELWKEISDEYACGYAKVKSMQEAYSK